MPRGPGDRGNPSSRARPEDWEVVPPAGLFPMAEAPVRLTESQPRVG